MLLIYTVKSDKNIVDDRGKKKKYEIRKDPLSFEIWIFRNSQPDRGDDRRSFVETTST